MSGAQVRVGAVAERRMLVALPRGIDTTPVLGRTTKTQPVAEHTRGFVYCVARKGVTGTEADFSATLDAYLSRCHAATSLPIALGFVVKERSDVDALCRKPDIAVIGCEGSG